jgi:uncharacterized protein involved in response to NO
MDISNFVWCNALLAALTEKDIISIVLVAGIGFVFLLIVVWGARFKPKFKKKGLNKNQASTSESQ